MAVTGRARGEGRTFRCGHPTSRSVAPCHHRGPAACRQTERKLDPLAPKSLSRPTLSRARPSPATSAQS
eukprot:2964545-Prymnesium_polylepis.1